MSTRTKPWSRRKKKAKKAGHYSDGRVSHSNPLKQNLIPVAPRHDVHRQCTGKKTYSQEAASRTVAKLNDLNQGPDAPLPGLRVRSYTCPWCMCVHIGRFASMGELELSPVDVPEQ